MNIYLLISENVRNSIQACYSCGWIVLSCDSSSPLRSVWVGTGTCLSEWTFTATAGMTFSFDELTFYPWTLIILQLQFDRLKLMIMSRTSIWLSQEIPCNQYWTCIAILMVCFWGYHTLCSDRVTAWTTGIIVQFLARIFAFLQSFQISSAVHPFSPSLGTESCCWLWWWWWLRWQLWEGVVWGGMGIKLTSHFI